MEADPALGRTPGGVVVDAPTGEDLDLAVVHPDGNGHFEDPLRGAANWRWTLGSSPGQGGGIVDPFEDGPPRVVRRRSG